MNIKNTKIIKRSTIILFIGVVFVFYSCEDKAENSEPLKDLNTVTQSFMSFWVYYNEYVKLSENFIGLDSSQKTISRNDFLLQLKTGEFLPLKLKSKSKKPMYRLYKISPKANADISRTLRDIGSIEYQHYRMEGRNIANFVFKDIKGRQVKFENFKNKILIVKFWFIQCQKCVEEMPEFNSMIESFHNRNDIEFISFALDNDADLLKFLKKTELNCTVIGNQKNFIKKYLEVKVFPTYLIIDKTGKIYKAVNSYKEIELAMKVNWDS